MWRQKGRTIQRERRIYHGDYLTVPVFPVFQKAGKRSKACKPSSDIQKLLNQKYREQKLTCLINTNFKPGDLEIGLGYDDEFYPETYADVQRDIRNYIRRIKRYREKHNMPELKYVYTIERGERNGRFHAHMITNGDIDRDTLEGLWGKGYAHALRVDFNDEGLRGLAKYKVKEPETEAGQIDGKIHRWAASKNLKKPYIPKDRDGFISKQTVKDIREGNITEREIERLYPGYTITSWEPLKNNINAGEYIIIQLRKTQTSREAKEVFKSGRKNKQARGPGGVYSKRE